MTQLLIDRATLEQLIHGVEMGFDFDDGDVFGVMSNDMTDALSAGRAALANAEPTGWQPIDTAPATANNVLAFRESGSMKIETGFWLINMLHAAKIDGDKCNYTHWMPLPTPPKDAL